MKTSRRRNSRASPDPNMIGNLLPNFKSLQRQHQITLRRIENIQRKLDANSEEDITPPKTTIAEWFRSLVRK